MCRNIKPLFNFEPNLIPCTSLFEIPPLLLAGNNDRQREDSHADSKSHRRSH
jgi:hypothetical protein